MNTTKNKYYYNGIIFNLNVEYNGYAPKFLTAAITLALILLEIIIITLGLYIINWCWNCPEWLSVTPKHILGIIVSMMILKGIFRNSNKS